VTPPASCPCILGVRNRRATNGLRKKHAHALRDPGCRRDVEGNAHPGVSELDSFVVPYQTVLYGPVTDEAALYGLLVRFQNLGLRVVEMRQLPE
jgi:hypothetical protein